MSRRRARSRRSTLWLWALLALAELLAGAYLADEYGAGPVILATVLALMFAGFHESRRRTRRQFRRH